nr:MAG TPA: hypothetical protein [Caudoviricetes sp.]
MFRYKLTREKYMPFYREKGIDIFNLFFSFRKF